MKRKTLTLVLCLLATFALASVGFAAWVLTNPDVTVTGDTQGDFTVYSATDASVSVKASFDKTGFVFGAPVTPESGGNPWLTATGMATDVLTVNVTLTIANYASLSDAGLTIKIYPTFEENEDTSKLKSAITSNYIACLTGTFADENITIGSATKPAYVLTKQIAKSTIQPTENEGEGTVTFALTFAWGTEFGEVNPFNYYYDEPFDAAVATKLNGLHEALDQLKFNLLITD